MGNAECNALTLVEGNKDRAMTTHKCDKAAGGACDLVAQEGNKTMEEEVHVLCVFVACENVANFSVITEIELQPTRDNAPTEKALPKESKATLTLSKTEHGNPKPPRKSMAQINGTELWARSEGSELKRTVTTAATIIFSVVALVMSVMFLPGLLFK